MGGSTVNSWYDPYMCVGVEKKQNIRKSAS